MFTNVGSRRTRSAERGRTIVVALMLTAALELAATTAAQGVYDWTPGFGYAGVADKLGNEVVHAATTWDDGSGPAIFVGGRFTAAGEIAATSLAKWNGKNWLPVGGGVGTSSTATPTVHALRVWNDGAGEALFVAGDFTTAGGQPAPALARWDGQTWTPLIETISGAGGGSGGTVMALEVFDDGNGPALFAAGNFTAINGIQLKRIARWRNGEWSSIGSSASISGGGGYIGSLTVFDDGTGPQLYAGGNYIMHHIQTSHIARWNSQTWSGIGGLSGGTSPSVEALEVFDDGSGPALFVGGRFAVAGGVGASHIARWDGQAWQNVGGGVSGVGPNTRVRAMRTWNDGTGEALYVGGEFSQAGTAPSSGLARWKSGWESVATGQAHKGTHLHALDFDGDRRLLVGAVFSSLVNGKPHGLALWDGAAWGLLGSNGGPDASVKSILSIVDAGQPRLLIAGQFLSVADSHFRRIAQWDGSRWSGMGQGIGGPGPDDGAVLHLAVHELDAAPIIVALGNFQTAGPALAPGAALWDGRRWRGMAAVPGTTLINGAVFDDGAGPALFAIGEFPVPGGLPIRGVAKWDGAQWVVVGPLAGWAFALEVFDDGSGPALYVGGAFSQVAGTPARNLARYDGQSWTTVGDVCASATGCVGSGGISTTWRCTTTETGPACTSLALSSRPGINWRVRSRDTTRPAGRAWVIRCCTRAFACACSTRAMALR